MKVYLTAINVLILGLASIVAQPLIMQPNISPDGSQVAFSYQGDVWVVGVDGGRADRITIHEGYDSYPLWSNDGKSIVFTSDRYGNNDVYMVSSDGGMPLRMTYHSANDNAYSVTPNGEILFTTTRTYAQVEREDEIYKTSSNIGTPVRFMDALGFDPVVSPDGTKVAFVRGTCRTAREDYRGPANRDIWVLDQLSGDYTQITDFEGNDYFPLWKDNQTLTYITSRSGRYNIHERNLENDQDQQLTDENEFAIISYGMSADGEKIVYQSANRIYLFETRSKTKEELEIDVTSDYRFDPVVSKSTTNSIDDFAISPNGKFIAYTNRGEVFVSRNDKDDTKSVRLTDGPARERDVAWLNDEKLLFISDRDGQNELYLVESTDDDEKDLFYSLKRRQIRLTNSLEEEEYNPVVSPNGEKIAMRRGRGKLVVADINSQGELSQIKTLLDGWDSPGGVAWSPDSKWLAYGLSDLDFNQEIYIHKADNSIKPVNISMHPKYDGSPVWSPDGSKLGFVSMRNNSDADVWFAWLKEEDWEKSQQEWARYEKEKDDRKKKEEDSDKEEEESGVADIEIDFENIYQRLERVTGFAGGEVDFAFDKEGEYIYYATGPDWRRDFKVDRALFKIKWDGSDNKEIAGVSNPYSLRGGPENDNLYLLGSGGKLVKVDLKSDKAESLTVKSEMNVNYRAELDQIFEEGWRALDAGFYDPSFHGQDWDSLKAKYKPLALSASTKEDFKLFFNLMLGQLNASHMGMYRGENQKETQEQRTGLLGIEGEGTDAGFKITRVVPNSPADRSESKLMAGDIITSINQRTIDNTVNIFSLLEGKRDERVLIQFQRNKENKEVIIWPTNSLRSELYDEWVEDRRTLVDEYSSGRLGYLHIQGMNWTSFERFERELMAAGYGKEGIVIDVRYNGGGWTTDYLMAVLTVKQHAYTIPRGAAESLEKHLDFKDNYPFGERLPLAAWTKPSIALCNQNSYSNAEIFSHAYKTLDLGTLVGVPTFGAVISTGGVGLQDGSYVRMPFRAWFVKATEENMENGPAVPDIIVENPPAYRAKNVDPQLKRSVSELLQQIEK